MKKFLDAIKDFLYDSVDYIIMIGIIGLVIFIIGWRLDLLFAKDAEDIISNENITMSNEEEESPDSIEDDGKEEEDPIEEKTMITVSIPAGSNSTNIADLLASVGLIASKSDFLDKSEEMNLSTKLKAGNFNIESGSSMEEILTILTK